MILDGASVLLKVKDAGWSTPHLPQQIILE
jgi:hypothetical protein